MIKWPKRKILNRKIHNWASVIIGLPFLLLLITGILLLFKKDITWIQPMTKQGGGTVPTISFAQLFASVREVEKLEVKSWEDITRIDIQPDKGIAKVTTSNSYEAQVDLQNAKILQVAYRRSDLIETLHDGTFFHKKAKYFYSIPIAMTLLVSLLTGIILFIQPYFVRKRKKAKTLNGKNNLINKKLLN
jgi:uncharacterized iron-regulated membrane protein